MLLKSLISRSQHFLRQAFICKLLFINSFNNTSFKPLNKSSGQALLRFMDFYETKINVNIYKIEGILV